MRQLAVIFLALTLTLPVLAQDETEGIAPENIEPVRFYKAHILEIVSDTEGAAGGEKTYSQIIKVEILDSDEQGKKVFVTDEGVIGINQKFELAKGDKIVVGKLPGQDEPFYYIADYYRLPKLIWILAIFFAAGIIFGGARGATSILGLAVSILILALFVVPQILNGQNPVLISLAGAAVIAVISIFLAHGFKQTTAIALAGTLISLALAAFLAWAFISLGELWGLGSEESFYLQAFPGVNINLRGLLLGGIMIGALGILDDVTTTQVAAVAELKKAQRSLSQSELYKRGISIGREHISALINTLALAYAGASLPLFLLFTLNQNQPLWVILNGELVAEELVRTLVGSLALILAVPITTFLAALWITRIDGFNKKSI